MATTAMVGFTSSLALAQDAKTYALVQINQQALFFNQMNEGAQEAADASGAETRDLQRQQ
jgi:ribose transport system substrate-binding protein